SLKAKIAEYQDLPEDISMAIDLHKSGLDYKAVFLEEVSVDYSNVPERAFVEEQLIRSGLFNNPDGSPDENRITEYIDSLDPAEVVRRGAELRRRFTLEHQNKVNKIRQSISEAKGKSEERRKKEDAKLREAISGLKDVSGFKITNKHMHEIYRDLSNSPSLIEHYRDKKGNVDFETAVKDTAIRKYAESI